MKYFNIRYVVIMPQQGGVEIKIAFRKKLFAGVTDFHIAVEFYMIRLEILNPNSTTHTAFTTADCKNILGTIFIGGMVHNGSDSKQEEVSN